MTASHTLDFCSELRGGDLDPFAGPHDSRYCDLSLSLFILVELAPLGSGAFLLAGMYADKGGCTKNKAAVTRPLVVALTPELITRLIIQILKDLNIIYPYNSTLFFTRNS